MLIIEDINKQKLNINENKINSSIFKSLDFFMVRTPILPLEIYKQLSIIKEEKESDNIKALSSYAIIKEAIALSSDSLYQSIKKGYKDNDLKKRKQIEKSLFSYINRMITRPTPYGILSGITVGNFMDTGNFRIDQISSFQKRSRPDMEWLLKLIEYIESKTEVVTSLNLVSNTSLYLNGNRAKLPYHTGFGQLLTENKGFEMKYPSINYNSLVEEIIALAKEPIKFNNLLSAVKELYPDVDKEKIHVFIKQLIEQEVLISEIRPSLVNTNSYEHLISKLVDINQISELVNELNEIQETIVQYDSKKIGEGEDVLTSLKRKMNNIVKVKNPIQTDLSISTPEPVTLPFSIREDVEKAAEILWRLSPKQIGFNHIEQYRTEFLEKYGPYREISILELLDDDTGLGAPATYQYPPSLYTVNQGSKEYDNQRNIILSSMAMQAFNNGSLQINLTDDLIKILQDDDTKIDNAPRSMELYFSIVSDSIENLNNNDYELLLSPNPGSEGAGKTFGRFIDILDEENTDKLKEIARLEKELEPDAIFTELVFLPPAGRSANVCTTINIHDYEIVIGTNSSNTKNSIPLTDIVVGASFDGFYLKSKSLNKKIIISTFHMLNLFSAPNVCRFMSELSLEKTKRWTSFNWGELVELPVLPRLKYGNIIISPAEWKINELTFAKEDIINNHTWYSCMQKWREEWKVPRYVYLTSGDNRILLDLDNYVHLEFLLQEYKKINGELFIKLIEGIDVEKSWISGNEGTYITECVFPLIRNHIPQSSTDIQEEVKKELISVEDRIKLIGDDWLYLKFYGMGDRQEEFIGRNLIQFMNEVTDKEIINSWFFIRYADPKQHIRIRIHGKETTLYSEGIRYINKWARQLIKEGLLSNMVIENYDPEIERYGGLSTICKAEDFFYADSCMISEWVGLKRWKAVKLDTEIFGVLNVINILENFGLNFEQQLEWLNSSVDYKKYLKEFRANKEDLLNLCNSKNDWIKSIPDPDKENFYNLWLKREEELISYSHTIYLNNKCGNLTNSVEDILGSIIHMSLNRLIGINRERENKIMTLARHTLYNLRYLKGKEL